MSDLGDLIREQHMKNHPPITKFEGSYRWLSNFYACRIDDIDFTREIISYKSVEAAFQAAKTDDFEARKRIATYDAKEAKAAGHKVVIRADWSQVKIYYMHQYVRQKFLVHRELGSLLLNTGDAYIEEGNWWKDTFWGVCDGQGHNWLGLIIMMVRSELNYLINT